MTDASTREPEHYAFDETTCDRCGRTNHVWSTPVEIWQQVYGPGGQPTRQGVLCPSCFIDDAEAAGVTAPRGVAGWTVVPDDRAEVERLRDGIRARHAPQAEEVERFHEDGDLEGACPEWDPRLADVGGCGGHVETIQVCAECGYDYDGDYPLFRQWPCPTVALLDDREETT